MKIAVLLIVVCLSASAQTYTTTFNTGNERPISQSGKWLNGLLDGLDWSNCSITNTSPTGAVGIGAQVDAGAGGNSYNDSTVCLTGSWGATQSVSCTFWVDRANGANVNQNYIEAEIKLRTTITSHSITGYELDWSGNIPPLRTGYIFIVRWDGPFGAGNFHDITDGGTHSGSQYNLSPGDILSATITNTGPNSCKIYAYVNGVLWATGTDNSCWNSGSPGFGFDFAPVGAGTYADQRLVGFTNFTAQAWPNLQPSTNYIMNVGTWKLQ